MTDILEVGYNVNSPPSPAPYGPENVAIRSISQSVYLRTRKQTFVSGYKRLGLHIKRDHLRTSLVHNDNKTPSSPRTMHPATDHSQVLAYGDGLPMDNGIPSDSSSTNPDSDIELDFASEHEFDSDPEDVFATSDDDTADNQSLPNTPLQDAAQTKKKVGVDLSLPPIDNVEGCFDDMVRKACLMGFANAVKKLSGCSIRFGT